MLQNSEVQMSESSNCPNCQFTIKRKINLNTLRSRQMWLTQSQSYKINLVFKKARVVLKSCITLISIILLYCYDLNYGNVRERSLLYNCKGKYHVPSTSQKAGLTGLYNNFLLMSTTAISKPVFQEVDGTVILPLTNIKEWAFPGSIIETTVPCVSEIKT